MARHPGVLLSIIAAIVVVVGGAAVFLHSWTALGEVPMSFHGWLALSLGVGVSVALGAGLTTLVVISRRRGFDEQVSPAALTGERADPPRDTKPPAPDD